MHARDARSICSSWSLRPIAAGLLAAAFWLPGAARAGEISFPPDPIQPTSRAECRQLEEQYNAIARQLGAQAKATGDAAWERVVSNIRSGTGVATDGVSNALYREASSLWNQASEARRRGSEAWLRCCQQVRAYEEANRTPSAADRLKNSLYGYQYDQLPSETASSGLEALKNSPDSPPEWSSMAGTLGKSSQISGMLADLSGRNGAAGYVNQLIDRVGFDSLRTFMVKNSIGMILETNRWARAELNASLARLDSERLSGLVGGARQGKTQFTAIPLHGDRISADLLEAYRQHQGMYAGRGADYDRQIAAIAAEAEAARARAREAAEAEQEADQPAIQPAPGGGEVLAPAAPARQTQYSPEQCSQLLQQIEEYRRVYQQYEAAGHGPMIQQGIEANQAEYDQGCR